MDYIKKYKVVPVVVINELSQTKGILDSLVAGGLPIAEITFRTACAKDAIKFACENYKDMLIGAGTVINETQCNLAIEAGAKFIVSPGLSVDVYNVCKKHNILYLPGCVTPTEIMQAISLGLEVVKFFPANVYGGLSAMKSLSAPFPQIKFLPTGGIDASNLKEYLAWDKIFAVGGSFMMKGSFENVVKQCGEIEKIVKEV